VNSQQAKQLDFPDLLARLGHEPIKSAKAGRELWYRSPFRTEKTASFHTSYLGGKWIWKDFGDEGGNVIDFVMRYENCDFKHALSFLRNLYQGSLFDQTRIKGQGAFSSHQQELEIEEDRALDFLDAHPIQNPVILDYLSKERRIPPSIAKMYLLEVKYRNTIKEKLFFAFGMLNESGGYEIRSASDRYKFKSALLKRDISVVQGREPELKSVSIFEGMTDFLSLLVLRSVNQLEEDAIVMHSVSSFKRTVQFVEEQGYEQVFSFLDNDETGEKYRKKLRELLPNIQLHFNNQYYQGHKDLNVALVASNGINPSSFQHHLG
jgi:5S rRNA maturation endonuclease (ribonuclease M5)